jgi:two-component system invasion response regulator UvrY
MRILIVDDHSVVRRGLRQLLAEACPTAEFGEAETSQKTLEHVWHTDWDIVVLDLNIPGRNGLEVLKEIKASKPKTRVLVLSMHSEDQYALRAIKAGADGYVTKESADEQLVDAVKTVIAGRKFVSPRLAQILAESAVPGHNGNPHDTLSDREFEVFRMLAAGRGVSEIAVELSLSIKTISTYRTRVLEKLNLKTNSDLIRYAVHHGLVQ